MTETPIFQQLKVKTKTPLMQSIKEVPLIMIGIMGISWLVSIITFGTYVFIISYLHQYLNVSISLATLIITIALIVDAILEPFIAIIADKVGLLKVSTIGVSGIICLAIPIFKFLATGNITLICVGMILMSILIAITYAPLNAYMVSLFPSEYRYTGFGVSFNIGISLFGGTTPLVMIWLVSETKLLISPAFYYIFGAVIGLLSIYLCELSKRRFEPSNRRLQLS